MTNQAFTDPPSLKALQILVPELVRKQAKSEQIERLLYKAGRNWAILRSLYGLETDSYYLVINSKDMINGWFLCAKWIEEFFQKYSKDTLTLKSCLCDRLSQFSESEFQKELSQYFNIDPQKLEEIFSGFPFQVSEKTIRNDFQYLANNNWLKKEKDKYQKLLLSALPSLESLNDSPSPATEKQDVETELFDFLHEELFEFADSFYQKIKGKRRFLLLTDYVVPEESRDRLGELQNKLKQIWNLDDVAPVEIAYDSASAGETFYCIVYPICIYYYQRAPYLCAFGRTITEKNEMNYYNYRLDRIRLLKELEWSDRDIPPTLQKLHQQNKLPEPDDIQIQLEEALGFDFFRESALMLLRFNADFHQRYIKNTVRHSTFEMISVERATQLIQKSQETKDRKQQLLKIVKNFPQDAYYKLNYRVGDNNVIMRLRAWIPNVEILLPYSLRQSMMDELRLACKIYEA